MTRGPGQRGNLEVFVREAGSAHWAALPVRKATYNVNADGRIVYGLQLPPGSAGSGAYMAQVLVLRHYIANTDVHYLPKAYVELDPDGDADLRVTGQRSDLPEMPEDYAGWEGRHATFLSYTASARVLDDFLAFLRDLAPLGAAAPTTAPTGVFAPGAFGRAGGFTDPRVTSGERDVLRADPNDLAEFLERAAQEVVKTSTEPELVVETADGEVQVHPGTGSGGSGEAEDVPVVVADA